MRNTALFSSLAGLALMLFLQDYEQIDSGRAMMSLRQNNEVHDGNNRTFVRDYYDSNNIHHDYNDFCSLAQHTLESHSSPSHWWTTHLDDILHASQHPQDPDDIYRDWTLQLLASLSPEMLQQGVKARPSSQSFKQVAEILYNRILHPDTAPPLKIAVVGGSVTRGQGCNQPILPGSHKLDSALCAWPSRLERLINTLAGFELVQVSNLAVSATTLRFGTPLIKYWFYPNELLPDGPDIIISSYSSNEQSNEDTTKSVKFANRARNRIQEFITTCRKARPCKPPLVLFVDDYLGNFQDNILGEMTFSKITTELAEWYGEVMHVSHADVVRRFIYADTTETTFTSPWPIDTATHKLEVQVHFGMAGHVAIAWSILYAMVDVVMGYCENQVFVEKMKKHSGVFSEQVADLVNTVPPPKLRPELLLQDVSREWQDNAARTQRSLLECDTLESKSPPCTFAFLAGVQGWNAEELHAFLQPYLIENTGWETAMDYGAGGAIKKPGLVATEAHASMTLHLTHIDKEVRMINVQRIKSYGDKWVDSNARFTVRVENPGKDVYTTQFDVDGYHKSKTR